MPQKYKYKVTIPGSGSFRVGSDTELTQDQAYQAALQQARPAEAPAAQAPGLGAIRFDPSVSPEERALIEQRLGVKQEIQTPQQGLQAAGAAGTTGLQTLGRVAKESAIPGVLGAAGLVGGGALGGPLGATGGAVAGGAAGEAINQALGITERSPGMIAASGATELLPLVGRPVKSAFKQGMRLIPGVRAIEKQPMVAAMEKLPDKFRPARPSQELFQELGGMGDVNVRFPETIKMTDELLASEARILPGLRSNTIEQASTGAPEILSTATPPRVVPGRTESTGLLDASGRPITREIPEQLIHGRPDVGVPFEVGQDNLKRLGAMIQQAENGITQENAGALRRLRAAMLRDMDAATAHLPKLKEANQAFKREMALEDLQQILSRNVKAVEGKEGLFDFNAAAAINSLRKLTNPVNKADYDPLFAEGLGKEVLEKTIQALDKINDFGRITFGLTGPSSLVQQRILAGLGGAAAGSMMGGTIGGAIGGLAGASIPHVLSEALTKPGTREFVLRALQPGPSKITNWETLAAVLVPMIARTPRMQGE